MAKSPSKNGKFIKPTVPAKTGKKAVKIVKSSKKSAAKHKAPEIHKVMLIPANPGKAAAARLKAPTKPEPKAAPASRSAASFNPPVPQAPVATDGKPRKNQVGLTGKELEHFRDLLLAKRRELVGDMSSMEREALRSSGGSNLSNLPIHMADMGTDNYEQEFTLGLVEKDRVLLREINIALGKIMNGAYGVCEGTSKPISKPRLEAQPWARFSIEHARQLERNRGIR